MYIILKQLLSTWPTVLLAAILLWATVCAWPLVRMWTLARKLPGPTAWPLVGNALSFLGGPENSFQKLQELAETHGSVTRLWVGHILVILISDPVDAQLILTNPNIGSRDAQINHFKRSFAKNSVFTLGGEEAQYRRKLMAPAFHMQVLGKYVEIFGRKAEQMAEDLIDEADGQKTIDIVNQLSVCTLSSFFETTGMKRNFPTNELVEMQNLFDSTNELIYKRVVNPLVGADWIYACTANGRRAQAIVKKINSFFEIGKIIAMSKLTKNDTKTNHQTPIVRKKAQSFVEVVADGYLDHKNPKWKLTENEIRDDVSVLAGAAMDTSAQAMAYVLVLLGMHPEYQERVAEEQNTIFQGSLRPATLEDLPKMVTLEHAIKEALRLFPPVCIIPREIPIDLPISRGNVLPAGCTVHVFAFYLQRNVDNFVEPERFWPERWMPENSVGRHPFAYLPFGGGTRNCIGQKYSQMQMKITLSRLLRQFRFTSGYTMEELNRIEIRITNKSVLGYNVKIFPRM